MPTATDVPVRFIDFATRRAAVTVVRLWSADPRVDGLAYLVDQRCVACGTQVIDDDRSPFYDADPETGDPHDCPGEPRTWHDAHALNSARIAAHPDFARLVRAAAADGYNQAAMPGVARLRRNSLTYGAWATRGNTGHHPMFGDRAQRIAAKIAADLNIHPWLPATEGIARVYGEACDYVRARRLPPVVAS